MIWSARRAAVLAAGAMLVSGVSACGDDPRSELPAPEDAERGEQVDVDAFLDALQSSFDDGMSAHVSFDLRGPTRLRGRGIAEYDADGMDVDVRLTDWQVEDSWINLRTVGGSTYMLVPESRGLWVDIGSGDEELAASVMVEADPRSQIEQYRDEITEVRFNGDEVVAGVPARRYQVVAETETGEPRGSAGPEVTEYWFDEEGRVIRRSNDLGASGSAEFTWRDWGSPVDIAPPPDETVISLRELERLRRQQAPDR